MKNLLNLVLLSGLIMRMIVIKLEFIFIGYCLA